MNYESNYTIITNNLFTAVKESADVLLKIIREGNERTAEFENGKHRYNALWDLVVKCKLVEEYEAWEWAIQDGDEE